MADRPGFRMRTCFSETLLCFYVYMPASGDDAEQVSFGILLYFLSHFPFTVHNSHSVH